MVDQLLENDLLNCLPQNSSGKSMALFFISVHQIYGQEKIGPWWTGMLL